MRALVCVVLFGLIGCTKDKEKPAADNAPAAPSGGTAAGTAERDVGAYDGVVVTGSFDVTLTAGAGPVKVDAPADWLGRVSTVVKDGTLHIGFDPPNVGNAPRIAVSAPGDGVHAVTLSGSGNVKAETALRGAAVALVVSGSGDIAATVESDRLDASVSGSGSIDVKGAAKQLEARVSGSGEIGADELTATDANVSITGSGDVDVKATGKLSCQLTGSGDLRYHGTPPKLESCNATGSGKIGPA